MTYVGSRVAHGDVQHVSPLAVQMDMDDPAHAVWVAAKYGRVSEVLYNKTNATP